MPAVDPTLLHRRWVHAHEEDGAGEMVFRPADFPLPRSRGRAAFELKPDGTFVESRIGPTDRPSQIAGTWRLEGGDKIVLVYESQSVPARVMPVVAADEGRLVIRR